MVMWSVGKLSPVEPRTRREETIWGNHPSNPGTGMNSTAAQHEHNAKG
jgi:hypothetical protein